MHYHPLSSVGTVLSFERSSVLAGTWQKTSKSSVYFSKSKTFKETAAMTMGSIGHGSLDTWLHDIGSPQRNIMLNVEEITFLQDIWSLWECFPEELDVDGDPWEKIIPVSVTKAWVCLLEEIGRIPVIIYRRYTVTSGIPDKPPSHVKVCFTLFKWRHWSMNRSTGEP